MNSRENTFYINFRDYELQHQNHKNKFLHCFGVPIVTFSILVLLSWLRLDLEGGVFTGAMLLVGVVLLWHVRINWRVGLIEATFVLPLLVIAELCAQLGWYSRVAIFLASFLVGWFLQLLGHHYEGKRPAFLSSLSQLFNGPFFLANKLAKLIGVRTIT